MAGATPNVRFLELDSGARLAYAVHGAGPPLVCPAWWVSHLEDDWQNPGFRALFGGLADRFTVVRYDRPGAGLSDRSRESVDVAGEVSALARLVDHLELERFSLFAVSCAGPIALRYAAANPGRVDRLAFFGSFVDGADVGDRSVREALQGLVRAHWGMGARAITSLFAPDLSRDEVRDLSRQHRRAAEPEMAAQLLAFTFDTDATAAAAAVAAPALVLHRKGDRTVRHDAGRRLAASLADASFHTLEGNEHVPWLGDVAAVRDALLAFFGAPAPGADPPAANELRQVGDLWAIAFAGRSVHLKDARGLRDLATLLANPGQEIHAARLWTGDDDEAHATGGADPVLDERSLASYRARLDEIESEIAAAEKRGQAGRVERYRQERDAIAGELRAAVGLGGRKRRLGDPSERARKAVTARIRASIKKIAEVHPELGDHLRASVFTGTFCRYEPERETRWVLGAI